LFEPIPRSEFRSPPRRGMDDEDDAGNYKSAPARTSSTTLPNVRSNVVFAGNAPQAILINNMNILAVQPTVALNSAQRSLFLFPEVFPVNATHQGVEWSIVSGGHLATINANGVLTGLPGSGGTIRVRAVATDGSDVWAERNIPISAFSAPCDLPTNLFLEQLTDSTVSMMWGGNNDAFQVRYFDTVARNVIFTRITTNQFYNSTDTDFPKSGVYSWSVRGICGTDTTVAVQGGLFEITITSQTTVVNAQTPNITAHPQSAVYTQNATATALSVTANVTDGGILSYQWFSNTQNSNTGGTSLGSANGAQTASFTPPTTTVGVLHYYVVVTNTNTSVNGNTTATATSSVATITVNAVGTVNAQTPSITAHPQSAVYTQNATAVALSIAANVTDGGTLTYQWFRNTVNSTTGGTAVGTGTTFTPPTNTVGILYYYVVVTNTNTSVNGSQTATATSNVATITVNQGGTTQPPTYIVNIQPATNGTITVMRGSQQVQSPAVLDSGTMLTLIATPAANHRLVQWWDGDTNLIRQSFVLRSNLTISATFQPTTTSIQVTTEENILTIYPNPVQTKFVVSGYEVRGTGNPRIEMFDMKGNLVHVVHLAPNTSHPVTVNVQHLPEGTYIVRVGAFSAKIVKQ